MAIEHGAPGGSTVGIGVQSAYGTAVARTMWLDAVQVSAPRRIEGGPLETLTRSGAVDAYVQRSIVTGEMYEIEIVAHLTYDGPEAYLLAHALGKWSTGPAVGGVYPHTMQTCLPHEWHQHGLTLEVLRGAIGASRSSEVYDSAVVVEATIEITPDQPVRVTYRLIARRGAGRSSAGVPAYQQGALVMGHHCTGLTWTGVLSGVGFESGTLQVSQGRESRREVGSLYTQYPTMTGRPSATLQVSRIQDTHDVYAAFAARTNAEVTLGFVGASPLTLDVTLQGAEISEDGYTDDISGPGYVTQDLTLRAMGDIAGSDPAVLVEIGNENDSLDVSP